MLIVNSLKKSFLNPSGERINVLSDISFTTKTGEMIGITGVSGAGKSTLLHLIGGLEDADEGKIKLNDFDVTKANAKELETYRQKDVGFVFQFHHLLSDLNALENVAMPLLINRMQKKESLRRARLMLERMNLNERVTHSVGQLSGGEQQRIAIARALVTEPILVLADEPTGNLDSQTGAELGGLLKNYAQTNNSIVIIATHNEHIAEMCDRTLILQGGRLG